MVKTLESELGTLIKGAVLLLYIMVFYFENSEFCFFKTFFLIGESTLLLTLFGLGQALMPLFWSVEAMPSVILSGLCLL